MILALIFILGFVANYLLLYLKNFKSNMRNILDNTKVINSDGEDITPKKGNK
ncbi:DUF896 domain-containing protein [Streptococcus danieliae]|nr:DUF896 domain-containing protein [Streptococcus danieliae]